MYDIKHTIEDFRNKICDSKTCIIDLYFIREMDKCLFTRRNRGTVHKPIFVPKSIVKHEEYYSHSVRNNFMRVITYQDWDKVLLKVPTWYVKNSLLFNQVIEIQDFYDNNINLKDEISKSLKNIITWQHT